MIRADQLTEAHHQRIVGPITGTLVGSYHVADRVALVVQVGRDEEIEIGSKQS